MPLGLHPYPGGIPDNSPTFQRWVGVWKGAQVPKGRPRGPAESAVPSGLKLLRAWFPTLKRWAIVACPFGTNTSPRLAKISEGAEQAAPEGASLLRCLGTCMRRKLLIALVCSGTVGPTPSEHLQAEEAMRLPHISFAATNFDFGQVTCGEPVKHNFIFTNAGTAVLEITEVKPGCGCTTAGEWDRLVPPGRTGTIPLQFNSAGLGGAVAKTATVSCNDPTQTNVVLQLSGTVWKPIEITPAVVVFQPSDEDQAKETKDVRIVSNLEEPVTLSNVECTDPAFRAELKTVKAGKEFELQVTALPPFSPRYAAG